MLLVQIDKQEDFISLRIFAFIWHNTLIILVYSDEMTSEARTHIVRLGCLWFRLRDTEYTRVSKTIHNKQTLFKVR